MICIVQRVAEARVEVEGQTISRIGQGLLVLAAVEQGDTPLEARWMADKLVGLRIFRSGEKHFEVDVRQVGGSILLVSNFTVAAATARGRRPSLDGAADPARGREMFDFLLQCVAETGVPVAAGQFAAHMQVHLTNDGPATFIVSRQAEQT